MSSVSPDVTALIPNLVNYRVSCLQIALGTGHNLLGGGDGALYLEGGTLFFSAILEMAITFSMLFQ